MKRFAVYLPEWYDGSPTLAVRMALSEWVKAGFPLYYERGVTSRGRPHTVALHDDEPGLSELKNRRMTLNRVVWWWLQQNLRDG